MHNTHVILLLLTAILLWCCSAVGLAIALSLPFAQQPASAALRPAAITTAPVIPATNPHWQWRALAAQFKQPLAFTQQGEFFYIAEQSGRIWQMTDWGQVRNEPTLDISAQVSTANEQGLLGFAFHPNFDENHWLFVHSTNLQGDTLLTRYSVQNGIAQDETFILQVHQPYSNHNGGMVTFGADGLLYLGLGDGGFYGDPDANGQNNGQLLGKILRLDVTSDPPYTIPADNPFAQGGGAPEIWLTGLRNPWRFSFDRATGDLWVGDVGQNAWEEVNFVPASQRGGGNFGWNILEGTHCYSAESCSTDGFIPPVWTYGREGGNCSVIGGYVYRGEISELQGRYFFGDYCSGKVWTLQQDTRGVWQSEIFAETGLRITSFAEDTAGNLYLISRTGWIYRLTTAQ
ncbi:MAG TPA: PQQ-dependent sugar dehydrogenase [Anaerolineales bacterium]|nr:PQQ-dependent sugar dehydrogenase [Anaerolineales bacterium]